MDIHRYASAEEAKEALAAQVSSRLRSFQEDGSSALLFFSGGSALGVFDLIDPEYAGSYLTIAPVDERYDPTRAESNFEAFTKTGFYKAAETVGSGFIDTRVHEGQGRDTLADSFENVIRAWVSEHPDGKTIAILGMGPDGHMAGIFPCDDADAFHKRFEGDRWVVGYRGPEYATCPERITLTISFLLEQVGESFVFLSGEEKRSAWGRVIRNDTPFHLLPAAVFHGLHGVSVFTDVPSS